MTEWISIEDKLPEVCREVLLFTRMNDAFISTNIIFGYLSSKELNIWKTRSGYDLSLQPFYQTVTHWMPLPEPPRLRHDILAYAEETDFGIKLTFGDGYKCEIPIKLTK